MASAWRVTVLGDHGSPPCRVKFVYQSGYSHDDTVLDVRERTVLVARQHGVTRTTITKVELVVSE